MNWNQTNVLITGAAGFIGRHLTAQLVAAGANVTALVRYGSRGERRFANLPNNIDGSTIRIIFGDLKDHHAVHEAARSQHVIFHLGALIGIPYSYVHPYDYVQTNICGTAHILQSAKEHKAQCVVVTSTSEVYGTAMVVPISEEHPLQAQSPYAASKIAADQLALSFYRSFDLPVAIVRPFNTYGPGQSGRAVIPTIISQALKGGAVKLGSLTPKRDLTFAEDTAAGMIRVAEVPEAIGQVTNLGAGSEVTIGELAHKIFAIVGRTPDIITDDARIRPGKSEVMCLLADTTKAKRLLNWSPKFTLDQGLEKTVRWMRDNPDWVSTDTYAI